MSAIRSMLLRWAVLIWCAVFLANSAKGDEKRIKALIDDLAKIDAQGIGYSASLAGSEFLPFVNTRKVNSLVFGGAPAKRSETLREIVTQGAAAVPILARHLDDKRTIAVAPVKGILWTSYYREYDFNCRTTKMPKGVNWDVKPDGELAEPDPHALTVGDLCFVAIGQIVNRQLAATRYQPSGGLAVNSPTHSAELRQAIRDEWADLTKERHRTRLIDDFLKPDTPFRRVGAYYRLALYFPDDAEALVIKELAKPKVDAAQIWTFYEDRLVKIKDASERRREFDDFVKTNGPRAAAEIEQILFFELSLLEVQERSGLTPVDDSELEIYGEEPVEKIDRNAPRHLLIELFGKPEKITTADWPIAEHTSSADEWRLLEKLTHDKSRKIAAVVKEICAAKSADPKYAPACLRCLANRDEGAFLVEQLESLDVSPTEHHQPTREVLEAIATSREAQVTKALVDILKKSGNEIYFMEALQGVDRTHAEEVLKNARRILDGLPADTSAGGELLGVVGFAFKEKAHEVYSSFLANRNLNRIETVCHALDYGNPLAKEILVPLLDDQRIMPGDSKRRRVCDSAVAAISENFENFDFNVEWTFKEKDRSIERLKKLCGDDAKKQATDDKH